jgi:catechol 2,3-dioxygenase-like lactoylglutathione lyase family enzyme
MSPVTPNSAPSAPPIHGVHHSAFRCRDAAETRHFYETVLGLPLKAALAFERDPTGGPNPYIHLFFEMGDGNYIAFFDLPNSVDEAKYYPKNGMEDYHVAMELADRDALMAMKARLEAYDVPVYGPIDHHFCHSIYFYDPNGINLEFTIRDALHDAIMAAEMAQGDQVMARWSADTDPVRTGRLAASQTLRAEHAQGPRNIAAFANAKLHAMAQKASAQKDEVRKAGE